MTMSVLEHTENTQNSLPTWDLSDLYPSPDHDSVQKDMADVRERAQAFYDTYQGKIASLSGAELGVALQMLEAIMEMQYKLLSYAELLFAEDMTNGAVARFRQNVHELASEIATNVMCISLEVNELSEEKMQDVLQDSKTAYYAPWLRKSRTFRDHDLDQSHEKLMMEKGLTGKNAWMRLYDETLAALKFPYDGKDLSMAEIFDLVSSASPETREKAHSCIGEVLKQNASILALITNTLAKDKAIDDAWRKYPNEMRSRNLANEVEDEVVLALVASTRKNYANISHRYYTLKAKWMGKDSLNIWDRNAPLPEDQHKVYTWDDAVSLVLSAYEEFSPSLSAIGQRFFDNRWIHAPAKAGKNSGAFAHPTVPSVHPYLLLNYLGKSRDVMTLAHELGHGVHQVLAAPKGVLLSDTPLTLAETASVFGEMLTFRKMLSHSNSADERKILLANKIEDMINTVVRQIAFHSFEEKIHQGRRKGELSTDDICQMWMDVQTDSLGSIFTYDENYRYFWSYIPHFIHAPFYVYAYAFGDCLVNSLYAAYQGGEIANFEDKYLDMLKAGGSLHHSALLRPFGLDASDPAFWDKGMSMIINMIDELETLLDA